MRYGILFLLGIIVGGMLTLACGLYVDSRPTGFLVPADSTVVDTTTVVQHGR